MSLIPVAARAETSDRLVYEIVVTEPGTRSQGWHGVLYDPAGNPIVATPGETVTTPIGEFIDVPCSARWDICGMIRADMVDQRTNDIIDSKPWLYRIYVDAEGSRSELWTGILLHDGMEIPPNSTFGHLCRGAGQRDPPAWWSADREVEWRHRDDGSPGSAPLRRLAA
jgi:hypothetical protein